MPHRISIEEFGRCATRWATCALLNLAVVLGNSVSVVAAEIEDNQIRDVTNAVKDLCSFPDRQGSTLTVTLNGSGDADVKLTSLKASAFFTKTEWQGIQDYLQDRPNLRDCVQKLVPTFLDKYKTGDACGDVNASEKSLGL